MISTSQGREIALEGGRGVQAARKLFGRWRTLVSRGGEHGKCTGTGGCPQLTGALGGRVCVCVWLGGAKMPIFQPEWGNGKLESRLLSSRKGEGGCVGEMSYLFLTPVGPAPSGQCLCRNKHPAE